MSGRSGLPVTARLFVALWPPATVLDQIEAVPRPELPRLRWTTRDQWHVTLRFLGDADPAAAEAALHSLSHPAIEVTVSPGLRRLGRDVLMLRVSGADSLAAAVRDVTASIGRPPGQRFAGHLTLARTRAAERYPLPPAELETGWQAGEVALVESELTPTGSRYRTIATVELLDEPMD